MTFLNLPNIKKNYFNYMVVSTLLLWSLLVVSSFFMSDGAERISVISAKIEFVVHFITLGFLIAICRELTKTDSKKEILWIFSICFMLFIVDFCFYIAAYADNSYLSKLSIVEFLLYYFPCIIGCFMMIVFVAKILLKDILNVSKFFKIVGCLIIINVITMGLFLTSMHNAFGKTSWETLS